jgi:hypothetical protein
MNINFTEYNIYSLQLDKWKKYTIKLNDFLKYKNKYNYNNDSIKYNDLLIYLFGDNEFYIYILDDNNFIQKSLYNLAYNNTIYITNIFNYNNIFN